MTYKILGGILITISIVLCIGNFKEYKTLTTGKVIEVEVLKVLTSCKNSNKSLRARFKFLYNKKTYVKNLQDEYCNIIKEGKKIKLTREFISTILLLIIGIIIFFKRHK